VPAEERDNPEPELAVVLWESEYLTKAGFVGFGNATEGLESIKFTVDIGGRSVESACVHKRPICMLRKACSSLPVSIIAGSIICTIFPCLYDLHACISQTGHHFDKT
jgi:hypothetical protein